jgi:Ca2+-binding RTX toxin-like protein
MGQCVESRDTNDHEASRIILDLDFSALSTVDRGKLSTALQSSLNTLLSMRQCGETPSHYILVPANIQDDLIRLLLGDNGTPDEADDEPAIFDFVEFSEDWNFLADGNSESVTTKLTGNLSTDYYYITNKERLHFPISQIPLSSFLAGEFPIWLAGQFKDIPLLHNMQAEGQLNSQDSEVGDSESTTSEHGVQDVTDGAADPDDELPDGGSQATPTKKPQPDGDGGDHATTPESARPAQPQSSPASRGYNPQQNHAAKAGQAGSSANSAAPSMVDGTIGYDFLTGEELVIQESPQGKDRQQQSSDKAEPLEFEPPDLADSADLADQSIRWEDPAQSLETLLTDTWYSDIDFNYGSLQSSNHEVVVHSPKNQPDRKDSVDNNVYLGRVDLPLVNAPWLDAPLAGYSLNVPIDQEIAGLSQGDPPVLLSDAGENRLSDSSGNHVLYGGAGSDVLHGEAGNDVLIGAVGNDILSGGPGNDILSGGPGDDVLHGGPGDDYVDAGSGNDILSGGPGDDVLHGDGDNNHIMGVAGHDTINGGSGDDRLEDSDGNGQFIGGLEDGITKKNAVNDILLPEISFYDLPPNPIIPLVPAMPTVPVQVAEDAIDLGGKPAIPLVPATPSVPASPATPPISADEPLLLLPPPSATPSVPASPATPPVPIYFLGSLTSNAFYSPPDFYNSFDFYVPYLSGAENFFESHNEQLERSNQGLKPIALVHFLEKLKNCCLFENPLFTRVSGVFCTTKVPYYDVLEGAVGDDALEGSYGDDTLTGGDANRPEAWWFGNDTLDGGDGNDVLDGGAGHDVLFGGPGNDTLIGDNRTNWFYGEDTLDGGAGDDILYSGSGDDHLFGGAGHDTLIGDNSCGLAADNDILEGGAGNDILDGGNGNDTLNGGSGNDILRGGKGDDILVGGDGIDFLIGGGGADYFELFKNQDLDIVVDFQIGVDKIQLKGISSSSITVSQGIGPHTSDTWVKADGELVLALENTDASLITQSSFLEDPFI